MKSNALCCLVFWAWLGAFSSSEAQTGAYAFSTLAGSPGNAGSADGTNAEARFNFPAGLAVDASGNLYVADIFNNTIRKVTPAGTNWVVTTIAGQAGMPGSADGTNSDALFDRPNGVAVDQAGNVFIADHYNHTIRQLTAAGTNWIVTTVAGLAGVHGSADGTNADARFWSPTGVAVDTNDHLYVTDTANFTIREIVPAGTNWVVHTIAGMVPPGEDPSFGFVDGTNSDAQFDFPYGITVDRAGRVYVADTGNNAIREITAIGKNWVVRTIAGVSGALGSDDGPGAVAAFNFPNSVCADQSGNLYVTDQSNDTVREAQFSGTDWMVATIGGLALQGGSGDGVGSAARFKQPWGVAVDSEGRLYVADYDNQTIRRGIFLPSLKISLVSQGVVLSWAAVPAGYVPEVNSTPDPTAAWTPLPNAPSTNGSNLILIDQPRSAPAFYRLRKVPDAPIRQL